MYFISNLMFFNYNFYVHQSDCLLQSLHIFVKLLLCIPEYFLPRSIIMTLRAYTLTVKLDLPTDRNNISIVSKYIERKRRCRDFNYKFDFWTYNFVWGYQIKYHLFRKFKIFFKKNLTILTESKNQNAHKTNSPSLCSRN